MLSPQVVLARSLSILSEMPALVTLLDLQTGTAAFQNRQSRESAMDDLTF